MKFITGRHLGRWLRQTPDDEGERRLDEQLENSFPASDPPSFTPIPTKHGSLHALKSAWNRPSRER